MGVGARHSFAGATKYLPRKSVLCRKKRRRALGGAGAILLCPGQTQNAGAAPGDSDQAKATGTSVQIGCPCENSDPHATPLGVVGMGSLHEGMLEGSSASSASAQGSVEHHSIAQDEEVISISDEDETVHISKITVVQNNGGQHVVSPNGTASMECAVKVSNETIACNKGSSNLPELPFAAVTDSRLDRGKRSAGVAGCPQIPGTPTKYKSRGLRVDDDSGTEDALPPWAAVAQTRKTLLYILSSRVLSQEEATWLSSEATPCGIGIIFSALQGCPFHSLPVSSAAVSVLTNGVSPSHATGLTCGRFEALKGASSFALRLEPRAGAVQDPHNPGARVTLRLLVSGNVFFNFLLQQWQTGGNRWPYLPKRKTLYCAFGPAHGARSLCQTPLSPDGRSRGLFVKVGYCTLGKHDGDSSLVRYIEKKSSVLELTNVPGAGLFVMPVPASHSGLDEPHRAAEESLKAMLRIGHGLRAVPSGNRGDIGAFSASLEYFWINSTSPDVSALQALTCVLRSFVDDSALAPKKAVARESSSKDKRRRTRQRLRFTGTRKSSSTGTSNGWPQRARGGTKKLVQWQAEMDGAFEMPQYAPLQKASTLDAARAAPFASVGGGCGLKSRRYAANVDYRDKRRWISWAPAVPVGRRRLFSAP